MNNPSESVRSAFLRGNTLRASINVGNPILAHLKADGQAGGVSVDLAGELAKRLGAELELVVFKSAGESVDAVAAEQADFGFFAIDPKRGEQIGFTDPYVVIEGAYLVRNESPIKANEDVDAEGVSVTVGKGSAYDLYLSRTLKHATIERAPTSPTVVSTFIEKHYDVAAGVKQQLQADAAKLDNVRMLEGHFMLIRQAMGVPKSCGTEALEYLAAFVAEMKASGFVTEALARHNVSGAVVPKPGD